MDLQPLLRQGRDFAELLVEVPIIDQAAVAPGLAGQTFTSPPAMATAAPPEDNKAKVISKARVCCMGDLCLVKGPLYEPPCNAVAAPPGDGKAKVVFKARVRCMGEYESRKGRCMGRHAMAMAAPPEDNKSKVISKARVRCMGDDVL